VIDPGGIPTIPGDMDALSGHATTLRGVGSDFADTGQRINSTWQALSGVYHAPEVGQLLAATSPVETISASVGTDMGTVAGALSSYATEVKQIQAALASLKSQAGEFVASTEGDDDWKSDDGKVDRNNQLISSVNTQMAAYFEAQRRCANTINALYGGPQYRADDGDGKLTDGEYGYTADQLNAAAGEDDALPWGKTEEKDRGLLGDVGAFFVGVKDGAVGFATGLGALIGRDPTTGDWSWGTAGTAWKGLGTFALAAGVYAVPGGAQLDQTFGVPGFERGQMGNTLLTAGKSLIAYDEWGKDKSRAAGMATFNVVSAVLGTKGAGAGLRGAGAAAEGSRIAAVSKVGTVMVHTGEAIGKLPTVTDLAKGIGKHFPNLHLPNFSGTTHINVPHHVDTPPIHTPDTPTVHAPHTPTVHTPTVHTPDAPTVHTPHADTPAAPQPGSVGDALNHTPTHTDPPASTPSAAAPSHHTDAPAPHHTDAPEPRHAAPATHHPEVQAAHHAPEPSTHAPQDHAPGGPPQHTEAPSHRDTPHSGPPAGAHHAPPAHDSAPGSHPTTHEHAPGEHSPQDHGPGGHRPPDHTPGEHAHQDNHAPGDHHSDHGDAPTHHDRPDAPGSHGESDAGPAIGHSEPRPDIPEPLHRDQPLPKYKELESPFSGENDPTNPGRFFHPKTVHYMSARELEEYRLFIKDGRLHQASDGLPFDTSAATTLHSGQGRAMFVMDRHGNLFASNRQVHGQLHHSSFLAGREVAGAGELVVEKGVPKLFSRKSGHYRPLDEHQQQVRDILAEQGIDVDKIAFTEGF
jgi:hypothetical protein